MTRKVIEKILQIVRFYQSFCDYYVGTEKHCKTCTLAEICLPCLLLTLNRSSQEKTKLTSHQIKCSNHRGFYAYYLVTVGYFISTMKI